MRRLLLVFAVLFLFASFAPAHGWSAWGQESDPQFGQRRNERDDTLVKMEKERAKRINKERQQRLKQDTDKLLALATELKQYVDKSNENILSLDVIRKAEEIEKLAHQVREKMRAEP